MGRKIVPVLILVVAAALVFVLAYSQMRPEPLKVSGVIEADEIRLGSRVGGRVANVPDGIDEGTKVTQGMLLVELEPFDLEQRKAEAAAALLERQAELDRLEKVLPIQIAQAKATVDRLTAKLRELENGPRPQEIKAAEQQLQLADAQLTLAQSNYNRIAALFAMEKGVATREAMDRSIEELNVAKANKNVREQELLLLQEGTREEEKDQAKAALREAEEGRKLIEESQADDLERAGAAKASAQAALEAIEQQLAELQITAPVDGVIEAFDLQRGDLVSAGGPVISMMDSKNMWVRAYVPENHLDIKLNQAVAITVDSYPDKRFKGSITFISRQGEFTPSNAQTPEERSKQVFRIKVTIDPGQEELRPGMAADVWLDPEAP